MDLSVSVAQKEPENIFFASACQLTALGMMVQLCRMRSLMVFELWSLSHLTGVN